MITPTTASTPTSVLVERVPFYYGRYEPGPGDAEDDLMDYGDEEMDLEGMMEGQNIPVEQRNEIRKDYGVPVIE